jgi:hypothetical protein
MGQMFRKIFRERHRYNGSPKRWSYGREQTRIMIFGHNTNLKVADATFHVQTEDRGESHALIDTTVYYQGRVLHRRTNNYFDLLPLDEDRREALKLRLDDQHRTVIEEVRNGTVQLTIPPRGAAPAAPNPHPSGQSPKEAKTLLLELNNANSWLSGKHAKLLLSVREPNGNPVSGAQIRVEVEGGANGTPIHAQTGTDGGAQIEFEMPRITSGTAALVIRAGDQTANGCLKFALRTKPRVA